MECVQRCIHLLMIRWYAFKCIGFIPQPIHPLPDGVVSHRLPCLATASGITLWR